MKAGIATPADTTNPSVLLALADRCEREESGSYDLDKEILRALGYTWRGMDYWFRDNSHTWKGQSHPTQSLDAAVTLVPDGWCWDAAGHSEGGNAWVMDESDGCEHVPCFRARTPALALCAAALRARAALNGDS